MPGTIRRSLTLCAQPEDGFAKKDTWEFKHGQVDQWDFYTKTYSEEEATWNLGKTACLAEVLRKEDVYRIFFDYDVYVFDAEKPATLEAFPWTEDKVYALRDVIHQRFPEIKNKEEIFCAMKASRLDRGKVKHSARFFIGDLTCPYDRMGDLLKERGFTQEEGWDLGIYGNSRRLLNCVHQYKPRDVSKTVLKSLPKNPADRSLYPHPLRMTAQFLYGHETMVLPIKDKPVKVKEAPRAMKTEDGAVDKTRLQKYLECIDPDVEYAQWFSVLCASFHTVGDDACEIVREWSAMGKKYDGDRAFYRKWDTLNADHETKAGEGTLRVLAQQGNPDRYKELFETYVFIEDADDTDYVNLYKCRDYKRLKIAFEQEVFKIEKPCMFYVRKSDGTQDIYSIKGLRETYMDVRYDHTDEKGKVSERSFLEKWLIDGSKKRYEIEKFDPSRTVGEHVYNTFDGFEGEKHARVDGDLTLILQHFDVMFGKDNADYVLKWFANILQHPTRKSNVALMLHSSKEGVGKSMLVKWFAQKIMGNKYYRKTADPKEDLFGRFANTIPNRLLVLIEEASGHDIRGKMDKLKDLITDNTCRLEIKGVAKMEDMPNYASFIFTTNNANPIHVSHTDRRFCTFDCDHDKAQDVAYFDALAKVMEDDAVAGAFYQKLMSMDLTGTNFQEDRPKTDYYEDLQQANLSSWALFLTKMCNEQPQASFAGDELYSRYRIFCENCGFTPMNRTAFMLGIKKYVGTNGDDKPIAKCRGKLGVKYTIDYGRLETMMRDDKQWNEDF